MRARSELRPYQRAAVEAAEASPQKALFMAVGDGKTIAAETVLLDLGVWPALVVAPAMVVEMDVWGEEARAWAHTQHIEVRSVIGTPRQRLETLIHSRSKEFVDVVSYENLRWLLDTTDVAKHYKAIVFDELSKMKTPGSKRFRAMRSLIPKIPVRLGLTGTPVGNHLLDLWGEMYMVGADKPLGPRFGDFRDKWFEAIDYYERVWRLKCCPRCPDCCDHDKGCECHAEARRLLRERIAPWVVTRPRNLTITGAPEVQFNKIRVPMPKRILDLSEGLMKNLWTTLPTGTELETASASATGVKLRQFAGGCVYTDKEGTWELAHSEKLHALGEVLDELQGEPAIIYYEFKHEKQAIARMLKARGASFGFSDEKHNLVAWTHGYLEVLLAHPLSTGFGLNLQRGGHHVIWYTLPWPWERFKQGNGRLARPGQPSPWVTVTMLVCGPVDDVVATVLERKGAVDDEVLHSE
jgi:SNF2 domain-containing protein